MDNDLFRKHLALGLISILFIASVGVASINGNFTRTDSNSLSKAVDEPLDAYTHTVFAGVGTAQNCKSCDTWTADMYQTHSSGEYDFQYVEMIAFDYDGDTLIMKAYEWSEEYQIGSMPTTIFDGNFIRLIGNDSSKLPDTLNVCGERTVANITANITLNWLGDATFQVNITITNNDIEPYVGSIRAFITEIVSRYNTYYDNPYHFGFLDYAFDTDIAIDARGEYINTTIWDGNEHADEHGDDFGDISINNIQVTLAVYNGGDGFVDETTYARMSGNTPPITPKNPDPEHQEENVEISTDLSWDGGDPDGDEVTYDVYFGDSNPPVLVSWNQSKTTYDPPGMLEYDNTYYWKIIARDEHGETSEGSIWYFTTGSIGELDVEIIAPSNGSFYLRNFRLFPLPKITFVYGPIILKANASSTVGIHHVEFYVNDELLIADYDEPYEQKWAPIFCSIYKIRVVAYDTLGEQKEDEILVFKWRVHPVLIIVGVLVVFLLVSGSLR